MFDYIVHSQYLYEELTMAMSVALALTYELDTYTPCIISENNAEQMKNFVRMYNLVRKGLEVASKNFSYAQYQKVILSLKFSAKRHAGVRRDDGNIPYFMHLLEVFNLLIEFGIYDFKLLVSAILHDVVEDNRASLKEVGRLFGAAIKNIVNLMTKDRKK